MGRGALEKGWGPMLEVWEGFAVDPNTRILGSSGGLATALATYCLEREEADQVVHTAGDEEKPWKNRTVVSRTREELLSRTGSRYAPASPCEGLKEIEIYPGKSVFIGKPCDVQGLRKAQEARSVLKGKTALAIGIFCAGTPSTRGTLDLLKRHGIDPEQVRDLRYRGRGWPGMFGVSLNGKGGPDLEIPYIESWGFLQKYRPYRCYLCPDGTSEFADISCGDPWYKKVELGEPGLSLIIVRTERGREIIQKAADANYIKINRVSPEVIGQSQKNLLEKRSAIWGRLLAMKLFGVPTPKYEGFYLYANWRMLAGKEKVRSVLGTAKRIVQRKYYRPTIN